MVKKISIIGSGSVGSSLAFCLLTKLNLAELNLIDICADLAKGTALDLEDTRGILGFSTQVGAGDDFSLIKGSDIVVITAGVARRQGMNRLDLLKTNAAVAREVSKKIKELAGDALVIVVTNPLDLITYIVNKETGFPRTRVLGMGVSLDTSRLLNILYKETKLPPSSLEAFVYGVHSKDMIVDLSRAKATGEPLNKILDEQKMEDIKQKVRSRGAQIVGFLKTRSAHFAPSLACFSLIEAIVGDSDKVIAVSVLLNGEYGLTDVCMGVPCVINREGVKKIVEIELKRSDKEEIEKVKAAFQNIKADIC
ncbi:MAG: malate dehydrogenase [Candidatus Omnitrophota bacterium]|nr:MAG: malate dehydrogenase [Candidatus Omnitrophota bacterium]